MIFDVGGPLVLAGSGKMGGAMLTGWLARGLDPKCVFVQDPSPPEELAPLFTKHGIRPVGILPVLQAQPAVMIVAVKPQMMDQVFPQLARLAGPNTLVLSIAAGRSIAGFERHLAPGTAVVRAMPNTPAALGRGITVCCGNAHVTNRQRSLCETLLGAIGEVGWIADELQMDAVTAVSGSGPAYVFLLAEAIEAAAIAEGLDPSLARRLARATVSGAGEMLRQSDLDAATLRQNVTSPGGTTAAALDVLMDRQGMAELMGRAIAAAARRGRELGQ